MISSPEENNHLLIDLFHETGKIVSIEGGLAQLACSSGSEVDIMIKMDAKQATWLPFNRNAGRQRETTCLWPRQETHKAGGYAYG